MPVTIDEILNRKQPVQIPKENLTPPIDSSLEGAPPSIPGGNDGTDKTKMSGKPVNQISHVDEKDDDKQKMPKLSYTELYEKTSPYKPPTEEDLEKERKKQKRQAIFAAISDGISAMSNLYFTTQYVPNSFNPSIGMSTRTKDRFDKLKKDREANQREYMAGYLRAKQMDDNAGYKEMLAQMKEREQKRKGAETNITIALKQADLEYKEAKKDGQAYINDLYRLKGQALEAGMEAQVELIEEKIKTEKAKQQKYQQGGSRGGTRNSGGSAPKKYPVFNVDGDVIDHVYTKDEAVSETERNGGTYPGQTRSQSRTQSDGLLSTKTTRTSTTTTPHAGRQPRKEKKPNPMEGSGNGGKQKKKNPMS